MPFPIFDKLEDIPESFRSEYEERDGKFHPKAAPPGDAPELKEALRKERDAREAAEKATRDAQRKLEVEEQKRKAGERGMTDAQLEELRTQVRADLEKDYGPFKTQAEKLAAENRTLKLDNRIKGLMGHEDVKVRGVRYDALWNLIKDDFDLTADGTPVVKKHPGLDPKQYLADNVKKLYPEFYEGTKAAGGGAAGVQDAGGTPGPISFEALSANPSAALQTARASGSKE